MRTTSERHVARPRITRGSTAVAAVLALAGLMFVVNAHSARGEGRDPQDLAGLAQQQADRVAEQSATVDRLRAQVDRLAATAGASAAPTVSTPAPTGTRSPGAPTVTDPAAATTSAWLQVASGAVPVSGPGLVVTLDDAPADTPLRDGVSADVLVVHQQDIQTVLNALWAGGAEAVSLQDQRLISTSAVRCVGNVLRLQGRLYSPPYVLRAIGDADTMRAALDADPSVRAYRRDAVEVGLGWKLVVDDDLTLPAFSGATSLQHAQTPAGVDALAVLGGTAG